MPSDVQGRYFGKGKPLFVLYFKTAVLTLFTLGIYRFWAKTRVRKYIWSGVTLDDDGMEYTGTGLEKFLGFLAAIIILAIYLGIIQMILMFFGLNLLTEPENELQAFAQLGAGFITVLAVMPLWFFALYRARRYKMARTRWRGIRFGMENEAWGYAWRAIGYYGLAAMTAGVLMPLASFKLEQYMANRTWYGDARFEQGGRWQDLYKGMTHVIAGIVIMVIGSGIAVMSGGLAIVMVPLAFFVGYIWFLIGLVFYRIHAFNYLTSHKVLDGRVMFSAHMQTGSVVGIIIVGSIAMAVLAAIILGIMTAAFASGLEALSPAEGISALIGAVFTTIMTLLVLGGLHLVLILQPIIEHAVNSVKVHNAHELDGIRQRSADLGADAEGFADALDVGGAI